MNPTKEMLERARKELEVPEGASVGGGFDVPYEFRTVILRTIHERRLTMTSTTIARAARMYHTNKAAAEALGIHKDGFGRMCRRYGIETPYERSCRKKNQWTKKASGKKILDNRTSSCVDCTS